VAQPLKGKAVALEYKLPSRPENDESFRMIFEAGTTEGKLKRAQRALKDALKDKDALSYRLKEVRCVVHLRPLWRRVHPNCCLPGPVGECGVEE
jgi:hypothetical protein